MQVRENLIQEDLVIDCADKDEWWAFLKKGYIGVQGGNSSLPIFYTKEKDVCHISYRGPGDISGFRDMVRSTFRAIDRQITRDNGFYVFHPRSILDTRIQQEFYRLMGRTVEDRKALDNLFPSETKFSEGDL